MLPRAATDYPDAEVDDLFEIEPVDDAREGLLD